MSKNWNLDSSVVSVRLVRVIDILESLQVTTANLTSVVEKYGKSISLLSLKQPRLNSYDLWT